MTFDPYSEAYCSQLITDSAERLSELRLLQLADSALPIGTLAHSFGLESLVAGEILTVATLPVFLRGYLQETGQLEAVFCRHAHRLGVCEGSSFSTEIWRELNDLLGALKPARESRAASASLGQNFLRTLLSLCDIPVLRNAFAGSEPRAAHRFVIHHSPVFGLACGALAIAEDRAVVAYLHQSVANLISACQRLLPLGQTAAAQIQWNLKPAMIESAGFSARCTLEGLRCFTPLLDWAAMEHPALSTRLFVS